MTLSHPTNASPKTTQRATELQLDVYVCLLRSDILSRDARDFFSVLHLHPPPPSAQLSLLTVTKSSRCPSGYLSPDRLFGRDASSSPPLIARCPVPHTSNGSSCGRRAMSACSSSCLDAFDLLPSWQLHMRTHRAYTCCNWTIAHQSRSSPGFRPVLRAAGVGKNGKGKRSDEHLLQRECLLLSRLSPTSFRRG